MTVKHYSLFAAVLVLFSTLAVAVEEEELQTSAVVSSPDDCRARTQVIFSGKSIEVQQATLQREILAYQKLSEAALAMRARSIRLYQELREKLDHNEPLSGMDLQMLNHGATAMLDQREALLKVVNTYECWLDDPIPQDQKAAAIQSAGIAMSLSAALVLYDNYISAVSLYRSDMVLRRHLNKADKGFDLREGELNRIAVSFASPNNRARVRRGLAWFENHGVRDPEWDDDGYRYLVQLIDQSPSREIVRRVNPVAFVGKLTGFFATLSFDTLLSIKDEGVFVPSLLFGNAVGLVESRRGKLDARPEVLERLATTAKAGDILLEKTPFRLTDSFIPGYWGHVAVWVGSEAELRELHLWNHPVVRKYHKQIQDGHGVVEALRSGVEMNTLQHFLNVDDVALLRQREMSDDQRAAVILQTLRQVGKDYDFNFDVETTDKIVCSELVYQAYGHIPWPTSRLAGRVTISPDNVALRALDDDPLSVEVLYHDGNEISETPRLFMEKLVKRPKPKVDLAGG